jgi:hypothetical protein
MALVKHPEHGNKHVSEEEAAKLESEGWVRWPRTKEQKGPTRPNPTAEKKTLKLK